jgi:hypothetical protein
VVLQVLLLWVPLLLLALPLLWVPLLQLALPLLLPLLQLAL